MDFKNITDYWENNRFLCSIGMAVVLITLFEVIPKVVIFVIYVAMLSTVIYFAPQIISYIRKWLPSE